MVKVTVTVRGLLEAAPVIVTPPLYVPAASPAGFTDTLSVDGVVLLAGATDSQLPPFTVAAVALRLTCAPLLVTDSVWAAGAPPPTCAEKVRLAGVTVSAGWVEVVTV